MSNHADRIVVIGAGIAGLCAAVYARRCGYEVELVEQHDNAGGLATSWRRGDYTFETCLHWLLGSDPASKLHQRWNDVCDIGRLTFVDHPELTRLETEQGDSLPISTDLNRLETDLLKRAPDDTAEIRRFVSDASSLGALEMPDPTESWHRYWWTMMSSLPRLPALRHWASITCAEYAEKFHDPLLRAYFDGGQMAQLSALAIVFTHAWMARRNAGYPIGGSQALIRLIVDRLRKLGGALRLGTKVAEVMVEADRAVGVRLADGATVPADWVISAGDGHAAIYDLLGGRYTDRQIDDFYRTMPTFASYLQVSLGVGRDLSAEPGSITRLLDTPLDIDPETQLRQVSFRVFNYDPTFAPPGKTAVTCFLPTRNHRYWLDLHADADRYAAEKQRIAEAVTAILERRMPGIRQAIDVTDVATPATVIRYTGNWKGSMEGWLMTPATGFKPLPTSLPGLARFMMVGHWVQPGGGLPSGLMTARAAMNEICKEDGVPFLAGTVH